MRPVDWEDPNSVKQNNVSSGTCSATWSWDGVTSESGEDNTYPTQFLRCFEALPSFFEMKFNSFDKAENFTLDLAHRYKDSEYVPVTKRSPIPRRNSELADHTPP